MGQEQEQEKLWRAAYLKAQNQKLLDSLAQVAEQLREAADEIDREVAHVREGKEYAVALVGEVANKVTWLFPNLAINRIQEKAVEVMRLLGHEDERLRCSTCEREYEP